MVLPCLIVTLDGPAGSGKSTLARQLAKRLGVVFLDTGSMYRAVALAAMRHGMSPKEEPASVAVLAGSLQLDFDWSQDPPALRMNGEALGDRIRDQDVTALVSDVAGISGVRAACVEAQQKIGREHPRLVTEGRDQGSVVFPDATVKFWVVADAMERAIRRSAQLHAMGKEGDVAAIFSAIRERDRQDATRTDSPMVRPQGAIDIDTSQITEMEALELLEFYVRRALRRQKNTASAGLANSAGNAKR